MDKSKALLRWVRRPLNSHIKKWDEIFACDTLDGRMHPDPLEENNTQKTAKAWNRNKMIVELRSLKGVVDYVQPIKEYLWFFFPKWYKYDNYACSKTWAGHKAHENSGDRNKSVKEEKEKDWM